MLHGVVKINARTFGILNLWEPSMHVHPYIRIRCHFADCAWKHVQHIDMPSILFAKKICQLLLLLLWQAEDRVVTNAGCLARMPPRKWTGTKLRQALSEKLKLWCSAITVQQITPTLKITKCTFIAKIILGTATKPKLSLAWVMWCLSLNGLSNSERKVQQSISNTAKADKVCHHPNKNMQAQLPQANSTPAAEPWTWDVCSSNSSQRTKT